MQIYFKMMTIPQLPQPPIFQKSTFSLNSRTDKRYFVRSVYFFFFSESSYASDMSLEIHSEFLKRKSEVEKAKELERIQELERQIELEKQREIKRQREIERRELERINELERQKELERFRIQELQRQELERTRRLELEAREKSVDPVQEVMRKKLYIDSKFDFFLNLNAIILMCVFVFLYCIFA